MILVIIKKDERFTNIPVTIYSTTMIETIATAAMFKDAFAGIKEENSNEGLVMSLKNLFQHEFSAIDKPSTVKPF